MHWSDLEHLIAFIKLEIIYWFFKKRHKIKGKIISLYLVEITIRKLRYCSLNTPHCPKSIPCGAILCCSCIRRLNTKVHASFIRGNKTKPISLPSNTAVAISIWSHQGASALTPTTPHHATPPTPGSFLHQPQLAEQLLEVDATVPTWVLEARIESQQEFSTRQDHKGVRQG